MHPSSPSAAASFSPSASKPDWNSKYKKTLLTIIVSFVFIIWFFPSSSSHSSAHHADHSVVMMSSSSAAQQDGSPQNYLSRHSARSLQRKMAVGGHPSSAIVSDDHDVEMISADRQPSQTSQNNNNNNNKKTTKALIKSKASVSSTVEAGDFHLIVDKIRFFVSNIGAQIINENLVQRQQVTNTGAPNSLLEEASNYNADESRLAFDQFSSPNPNAYYFNKWQKFGPNNNSKEVGDVQFVQKMYVVLDNDTSTGKPTEFWVYEMPRKIRKVVDSRAPPPVANMGDSWRVDIAVNEKQFDSFVNTLNSFSFMISEEIIVNETYTLKRQRQLRPTITNFNLRREKVESITTSNRRDIEIQLANEKIRRYEELLNSTKFPISNLNERLAVLDRIFQQEKIRGDQKFQVDQIDELVGLPVVTFELVPFISKTFRFIKKTEVKVEKVDDENLMNMIIYVALGLLFVGCVSYEKVCGNDNSTDTDGLLSQPPPSLKKGFSCRSCCPSSTTCLKCCCSTSCMSGCERCIEILKDHCEDFCIEMDRLTQNQPSITSETAGAAPPIIKPKKVYSSSNIADPKKHTPAISEMSTVESVDAHNNHDPIVDDASSSHRSLRQDSEIVVIGVESLPLDFDDDDDVKKI